MSEELYEIGLDELEGLLNEAEQMLEEATSFAQIGKFHSYTTAHVWDGNAMHDVDAKAWREHDGFKFLNLHVNVDTKEFNPGLQKEYERRIQVSAPPWNKQSASGKWESIPSDWAAIWEPSVKEATGLSNIYEGLKHLEGKYVKVLDVKQQPTKRQPEPQYNTAKLLKVYKSREEAYADYNSGKSGNSGTTEPAPAKSSYSEEIVTTVKALQATGKSASEVAALIGANLTEQSVKEIWNG